ncbi:hypothetical protein [Enterococcus sp. AZ196]|uniref:hypothetical protein n=1 Tax=Enterococcus sp. AZ196 TaxID=2774659 RepID=UPI003D28F530
MKEKEQKTFRNDIMKGSMELYSEEWHILLSVLKESIEQKRVQLEAIGLRHSCLNDDQLISIEEHLKTEIDKHVNLLRKVHFYEQGS